MTSILSTVIAGGIAGISEVLVTYPLDLVKTRSQLHKGSNLGVFSSLTSILKTEGFSGMYRGILSPILAEAPKRALKFTSNELYKPLFSSPNKPITWIGSGGAGALAGATETIINCPFEVVKVRLQAKDNLSLYSGTFDAVTKIAKKEGIFALYKGFEPQLLRNAAWNGTYFATVPLIKTLYEAKDAREKSMVAFIAGTIGGCIGTTLNTPLDVVKSRMQNQNTTATIKYKWSLPSLVTIYSEEGIMALYKGYTARILRLGPGGGIMYLAFQLVTDWLK
jgi:solute carrier family 25 2-oxodicarboxylate transporter 21